MDHDFKNLLKLLDDDNEHLAGIAMAELLDRADPSLERVLRTLQESPNAKLRKRIHQLQSAILHRRRRTMLATELNAGDMTLKEGMLQLHLFWFDNDTIEEITEQWDTFVKGLGTRSRPATIERMLIRFSAAVMVLPHFKETINPEALCIGTILEKNFAMDFMACIAALLCAEYWGFSAEIITIQAEFYLRSGNTLYDPRSSWQKKSVAKGTVLRKWNDSELIRLMAYSLFLEAVSTDSFRYIHTLGCFVMKRTDLKTLPYPYGGPQEIRKR